MRQTARGDTRSGRGSAVKCPSAVNQLALLLAKLQKKESTLAGLEPTRDKPNRFLVDRLNHSATVSSVESMVAPIFMKQTMFRYRGPRIFSHHARCARGNTLPSHSSELFSELLDDDDDVVV